jgi:hypothetical protein
MKRSFYLLGLVVVILSACQKQPIVPTIKPIVVGVPTDTTFTLAASDYELLPTTAYPSKSLSFDDAADAQMYIPAIMDAKFPKAVNNSTAAITYTVSPLYYKPNKDSLYADVYYKLQTPDYGGFANMSISDIIKWLPTKFPAATANQVKLLSFVPFPSTLTPPYSFMLLNGTWTEIYTINPSQYAQIGLGSYDQFSSSSDATLPRQLSFLLKGDATLQDTVKAGDIKYISFDYYASNDTAYQRVLPLEYDGNNYVAPYASTGKMNFVIKSGQWQMVQPLPVIGYTLTPVDLTLIVNSSAGSQPVRDNLKEYNDFESAWTTPYLDAAFILVLAKEETSPQINTTYRVSYPKYTGATPDPLYTLDFIWSGTAWVAQQ